MLFGLVLLVMAEVELPAEVVEWGALARVCPAQQEPHRARQLAQETARLASASNADVLFRVAAAWDDLARCEEDPVRRATAEHEAIRLFDLVTRDHPADGRADEVLARLALLLHRRDPERALALASRVLREHPQSAWCLTAFLVLGDVYSRSSPSSKAERAYARAAELTGQNELARSYTALRRGRLAFISQDDEQAREWFREAVNSSDASVRQFARRWLVEIEKRQVRWAAERADAGPLP